MHVTFSGSQPQSKFRRGWSDGITRWRRSCSPRRAPLKSLHKRPDETVEVGVSGANRLYGQLAVPLAQVCECGTATREQVDGVAAQPHELVLCLNTRILERSCARERVRACTHTFRVAPLCVRVPCVSGHARVLRVVERVAVRLEQLAHAVRLPAATEGPTVSQSHDR